MSCIRCIGQGGFIHTTSGVESCNCNTPLNLKTEEINKDVPNVEDVNQIKQDAVYEFARWWAKSQSKGKADWMVLSSLSEASSMATQFLSQEKSK